MKNGTEAFGNGGGADFLATTVEIDRLGSWFRRKRWRSKLSPLEILTVAEQTWHLDRKRKLLPWSERLASWRSFQFGSENICWAGQFGGSSWREGIYK
nr:hypothetical protein Iba_chr05dCG10110 [Ipomoea batatas]